ncbi:hypothetical protein SAMN05216203_3031 [Marinobacter daqiaonensis]|uniref:Glycosyltransferase n=1 Tax=Marinobacter daqiaonensis TaxID=650891 RepID=A0A1I6JHV6_9GAMM|nr:TIGR04282 family arsenosugar biosynthesis glycosyltransferase [Marinobacter daqiaonensis]SFR78464.1 hypothetical protein SAMN05216203_3031 [Marinobacter daqiaonensis]
MTDPVQLIQFAKWPEPGRVKTRLEPLLGREGALEAHIRLTLAVLGNLAASGHPVSFYWDRAVASPPSHAQTIIERLAALGARQATQSGADLGERMTKALEEGLGRASHAMIIGSDCPAVETGYIEQARVALAQADVVFGPSDDGGYVLIGARTTHPDMLAGVAWGTPLALEQSIAAVKQCGLRVATLSPRWDVDEPEDWTRFLEIAGQSPTAG